MQENRRNYLLLHFIVFIWGWTAILGKVITLNAFKLVWLRIPIALAGILARDKNKNTFKGNTIDLGSRNLCVIGDKRLIVTVGLDNLIVVDTSDALLLCRRNSSQKIRDAVSCFKKDRRYRHLL